MCATCGCGIAEHDHSHHHGHPHVHVHDQHPDHEHRLVSVERDLLEKNQRIAERNRGYFAGCGVRALNLVSSPGAGKTTLLERTLREAGLEASVIEGDQATELDAERVRQTGARAIQVNTGTGCHLDASMIARVLPELSPARGSVLFIENVGNLVCPALFDLGEEAKVLVASVTEGDDKPLKYPHMFRGATLCLLNKIDLLPHVRFDTARFEAAAREVNPALEVLHVSATRGDGLPAWYRWLNEARATSA
ncbi:MAG TPA: hydrogenase nickel incorporation protein HypB [Myxococcales bacterium]|nr:hydrogenase nickel incorporation protein HypB [Myxococcales bacterium]